MSLEVVSNFMSVEIGLIVVRLVLRVAGSERKFEASSSFLKYGFFFIFDLPLRKAQNDDAIEGWETARRLEKPVSSLGLLGDEKLGGGFMRENKVSVEFSKQGTDEDGYGGSMANKPDMVDSESEEELEVDEGDIEAFCTPDLNDVSGEEDSEGAYSFGTSLKETLGLFSLLPLTLSDSSFNSGVEKLSVYLRSTIPLLSDFFLRKGIFIWKDFSALLSSLLSLSSLLLRLSGSFLLWTLALCNGCGEGGRPLPPSEIPLRYRFDFFLSSVLSDPSPGILTEVTIKEGSERCKRRVCKAFLALRIEASSPCKYFAFDKVFTVSLMSGVFLTSSRYFEFLLFKQ